MARAATGTEGILVHGEILDLVERGALKGRQPIAPAQVQPASLDLRLGEYAVRVRTGFLPETTTVEERLRDLEVYRFDLRAGGVLERGQIYLVPLLEELALPADVRARTNPKSTTGRLDIFTRVVTDRNGRFDELPQGFRGRLWIEVAPRSFPVRVRTGISLNQVRFSRGEDAIEEASVRELHARSPLVWGEKGPLPASEVRFDREGGVFLRIRLRGEGPIGFRAKRFSGIVDLEKVGAHDPADFWEAVAAPRGTLIVEPEEFYIFSSLEKVAVPADHAAEMLAYDVGIGELRTNYAGFFDNGFGYGRGERRGTRAILEVRAHDVPFLVEDGQVIFRLKYFRTTGVPSVLYGDAAAGSRYMDQDLALAKQFRPFGP
ncbi:MAG TPA: 2'-deoxycytidine 5'-triphosphate deaminase [Planctomycetota bacterium]|jgi:dCTP deaminase|nr:2'-deoxycytidine 5'-triphosphate deaminase [Planctomycetota bacterium]